MVNTKIILIILMQPRMEKLYTVSGKKKERANCGSDHEVLIVKVLPFRLKC